MAHRPDSLEAPGPGRCAPGPGLTGPYVFISYRSVDATGAHTAVYLDKLLTDLFGDAAVFRSRRSVRPGDRFDEEARAALGRCEVLLALIGPGWLTREIWRDDDWVRREIATALERGVAVIPVLVGKAEMPARSDLPPDIVELREPQRSEIRFRNIEDDAAAVVRAVLGKAPALEFSRVLRTRRSSPAPEVEAWLPSALLDPEYGVVPFEQRDGELDTLLSWANQAPSLAARLLTGSTGSGKTRLALELCGRLLEAGWLAWPLADDPPPRAMARAMEIGLPLLVVVDRADVALARTAALARALAQGSPTLAPRRLLLTARSSGTWLDPLTDDPDDLVSALFEAMSEQDLPDPDPRDYDREREFARAGTEFARRLASDADVADPPPDLASWRYQRPLDIHVAALARVLDATTPADHAAGARPGGRQSPVARLLHHERRHWARTAAEFDLPDPHRDRLGEVVTAAALFGPADGQETIRLLAELPTFHGRPGDDVRRFATWVRHLYDGPSGLDALRPARLAEHHLATTGSVPAEIVTSAARARTDNQLRRALAILGHGSAREPVLVSILEALIRADLPRCFPLGIDVAHRLIDPVPLARVLDAVAPEVDGVTRSAALRVLPDSSVVLTSLALRLIEAELEACPPRASTDPAAAALLRRRALGLARVGEPSRALLPARESVRLSGDLAARDLPAHGAAYADASSTQARVLGDLGDHEAALASARTAVETWRALAGEAPAPGLAGSLNDLAVRLSRVGRDDEALAVAGQAAGMFEVLAAGQPNRFRPYLGSSLLTLGGCLSTLERHDEAVTECARAVEIFRELAPRRPDRHLPSLARALVGLSTALRRQSPAGGEDAGMSTAIAVCRRLAAVRPGLFLPELAPLAITMTAAPASPPAGLVSGAHGEDSHLAPLDVVALHELAGGDGRRRDRFLDTVIDGCVPVWHEDGDAAPEELALRSGEWHLDLSRPATRPLLLNALAAALLVERLGLTLSARWVGRVVGELVEVEARVTPVGRYALRVRLRSPFHEGDPRSCRAALPARIRRRLNEDDFTEFIRDLRAMAEPGDWFDLGPAAR